MYQSFRNILQNKYKIIFKEKYIKLIQLVILSFKINEQ